MGLQKDLETLSKNVHGRVSYIVASADGALDLRRGEKDRFPSASIIKLPILWSVFSKAAKGELALTEEMPLRAGDIVDGYGVLKGMHVGIGTTIEDLCFLMTVTSDNVATNMLIDKLGFAAINADIAACGMPDTVLGRKMLDAEARAQGRDNFTTPLDVLTFLKMLRHGGTMPENSRARMLAIMHNQCCNNFIPQYMPEGFRFAHKTGDIQGTVHDAGILYGPSGREYYVIVLCSDLADNLNGVKFLNDFGSVLFAQLKN
ncbi:conserved hypothetical protein [uncultured delta proteobacterium]|uniref:Beta-lactamase class A catalytic domain-containing protein n=1 Tax=uncultured delta proteobacterium TaxID=34034 RepID=A0A212IYG9_9DELT|nr:conserved hypothetical protein [uncultured delta proteobacterium]